MPWRIARRAALAGLGAGVVVAALPGEARAGEAPVWSDIWGNAIRGYDPVAYFAEGKPVEGAPEFEAEWNGATWRFASAGNRKAFLAEPERYAPQYGGYCAWAVSNGRTASSEPEQWTIRDGKLYLNYDADIQAKWRADMESHIRRADANWPKVLE